MTITAPTRSSTPSDVHVGDLQLFINGRWCEPTNGRRLDVTNPANGRRIGSIPDAGADDVDRAVRAADAGFADGTGAWPSRPMPERRAILQRVLDRLAARDVEIAGVESADGGRAIRNALAFHAQGTPGAPYRQPWPRRRLRSRRVSRCRWHPPCQPTTCVGSRWGWSLLCPPRTPAT